MLLGGIKTPEDSTGVLIGGDVLFTEGVIRVKIPEVGKEPVALADKGRMNTETVVVTIATKLLLMLMFPVGVEVRADPVGLLTGMVDFNKVELKISGVLSASEFVNGGPVELSDTFKLELGVMLAGINVLLGIDVVPLKNGVRLASEFVKGGPVDDEIKPGVDVTLTEARVPLANDVLSSKNGVRLVPEFVKGSPVDDEFRLRVGDALGVIVLAAEVEPLKKGVRGASVLEKTESGEYESSEVAVVGIETVKFAEDEGNPVLGVVDADSE